jgi:P-loop Domain of unknown function (DUF2791)
MLTQSDANHIFDKLRNGLVPERGLDAYAVGIEKPRDEIRRQLELVQEGTGHVKFLRGGYGCGKTFMARLAIAEAQTKGFVTSFVVVSDNDLKFHKFDEVYRKVVSSLSTQASPRGALGDILDRWIGRIEDGLIKLGANPDAPDFDTKVRAKLQEQLVTITSGRAPVDFVRVIQTIFDLKQKGEVVDASSLISWLSGSENVAASVKKLADIKGDISSSDALAYLRGILEISKAAGYKGMLIVIDEAETILRSRSDSRHKSLNGIRQICDASGDYPGLLWIFTGTPDFFDNRKGVAGLAPLHDRVGFHDNGKYPNLRQPQLLLRPFDAERLRVVAHRLRELYPMPNRARVLSRVSDVFIDNLVDHVTKGFKGDVGVVPRQFLRELINVMDTVDQHEEYDPSAEYKFAMEKFKLPLSPEEQASVDGRKLAAPLPDDEDDEDFVPQEQVW